MRECDFHKLVSAEARKCGWHVSSIESHMSSPGIPDLNVFVEGIDVWVELKVCHAGRIKMRPPQKIWHAKRAKTGGKSWVLVAMKEGILTVPGAVAGTLGHGEADWKKVGDISNILHIPHLLQYLAKETRNAW